MISTNELMTYDHLVGKLIELGWESEEAASFHAVRPFFIKTRYKKPSSSDLSRPVRETLLKEKEKEKRKEEKMKKGEKD